MESNFQLKKLKKNSDFLDLRFKGQKIRASDWLQIHFLQTSQSSLSVGVTTGRKVGSAVIRNRLKRWCREYFLTRKNTISFLTGNINLVFRPHKKENFYKDLEHELLDSILDKTFSTFRKNP